MFQENHWLPFSRHFPRNPSLLFVGVVTSWKDSQACSRKTIGCLFLNSSKKPHSFVCGSGYQLERLPSMFQKTIGRLFLSIFQETPFFCLWKWLPARKTPKHVPGKPLAAFF
ncbi:hypothetical protein SLA2020_424320 [Shorea laevis]